MSMYFSCPCSGRGLPFRQQCLRAEQVQADHLCVLHSFPLICSKNRRKMVVPAMGSMKVELLPHEKHTGITLGLRGQAGLWRDYHRLQETLDQVWVLCTTFPWPPFSTVLGTAPALPQIQLWVHSLQPAPAKPQTEEGPSLQEGTGLLNSGWRRQTDLCRKALGCLDETTKAQRFALQIASSLVQHSSHPMTVSHSNSSLICLNIFLLMDSQPLRLHSLVYTYPDPFLQRQAWWCCELVKLMARSKVAVTTQLSGTACPPPQAASGARHRGARNQEEMIH